MTAQPRALATLLANHGTRLSALATEASTRLALRERVRRCLPAAFAPQCAHAELEAGVLVVSLDSAAGATLLRYQLGELQAKLAADGLSCRHIRVQILPVTPPPELTPPTARIFEESVRQRLEITAASLEDGALRRSIRNLARHRRESR